MSTHHPLPEILEDYACGGLHAGAMLVVEAHVQACGRCREQTTLWEVLGGVLPQDATPEAMAEGAFARTLARIRKAEMAGEQATRKRVPAYLERFSIPLCLRGKPFGRRLWLTPNIWFTPIAMRSDADERTYLVHAKPNTALPIHTHAGQEFTIVLHGSFRDVSGVYGPSDFAQTDDTVTHAPEVTPNSDCLCLISADAPMRLRGRVARTMQFATGRVY